MIDYESPADLARAAQVAARLLGDKPEEFLQQAWAEFYKVNLKAPYWGEVGRELFDAYDETLTANQRWTTYTDNLLGYILTFKSAKLGRSTKHGWFVNFSRS